jgi:ribosomal protein L37AE/L43A
MTRNIVIRKCQKCGKTTNSDRFSYLGDGVWSCPNCTSKYTFIYEVIDPDEKGS